MRKVEAAAEQTAHVPPEVVWSLLSDVMVYPQGPWRKGGYRSEGDAARTARALSTGCRGQSVTGSGTRSRLRKSSTSTLASGWPTPPARNPGAQLPGRGHADSVTRRHPHPLGRIVGPDHHGPPGLPVATEPLPGHRGRSSEGRRGFPELNAAPLPPTGGLHALGQQSWIPGRSMPLRGMSGKSVELSSRLVYGGRDGQRRRYR